MNGPFVAGIDVGNSTTEVVVADMSVTPPRPVTWDRRPTVGRKGSERSLVAAAELLGRLEARAGVRASEVVVTPQRPVDTSSAVFPEPAPGTGRLRLLAAGGATPGAAGTGAGRPVRASDPASSALGPVVLVSEDPLGYRGTVDDVARWIAAGADVVGVLVAGDEAVLVSRRLAAPLPVVDRADTATALAARLVAIEVARTGAPVRSLTDPVRLSSLLGLGPHEHRDAEALARSVRGVGDAAVALLDTAAGAAPVPSAATAWAQDAVGARRDLLEVVASAGWDGVRRIAVPGVDGALVERDVEDVWSVDLDAVAADVVLRAGAARTRAVALAALAGGDEAVVDPADVVARATGRPVRTLADEAGAARAGALTTPGADPAATVLDVGGGTIDVVRPDGTSRVLAGAGDLVTVATAELLGVPRGQAEWVKRGPCSRVESPHVLAGEDGRRHFLDEVAPAGSVGRLVVPGPAGPLPFSAVLAPAEWRALRLRLKSAVLGDNVRRASGTGAPNGSVRGDVVVVGGPAGDDEVLDALARALPDAVPGRGDAAAVLGHRWAVAYGLVVLAASG